MINRPKGMGIPGLHALAVKNKLQGPFQPKAGKSARRSAIPRQQTKIDFRIAHLAGRGINAYDPVKGHGQFQAAPDADAVQQYHCRARHILNLLETAQDWINMRCNLFRRLEFRKFINVCTKDETARLARSQYKTGGRRLRKMINDAT
ncbi:MAG: Uncharacterised protein [SAR116 cluster bacterium]|nr:MAG: Uncharacterised protein [SAR116 cluster bacterium]